MIKNRRIRITLVQLLALLTATCAVLAFGVLVIVPLLVALAVLYVLRRHDNYLAIILVVGFGALTWMGVGKQLQMRLDTGDQRLVYWGIPWHSYPMEEHASKKLLSISEGPRLWNWVTISNGKHGEMNLALYDWYRLASCWVDVNKDIAKGIVRDLKRYVRSTGGQAGLPDCIYMLSSEIMQRNGNEVNVRPGWERSADVESYMRSRRIAMQEN